MSSSPDDVVLFNVENGNVGVITLNRTRALNALNLPMAEAILPKVKEWSADSKIKLIMIEGTGEKAFCAGGDVRAITEKKAAANQDNFFKVEYSLNNAIGTLEVPYVALIHGITMGGGVGLSVHGRYRVCTENTVFAMPETKIGFFPDVGGGFFLPRLRGELGMFLGLTGHTLKGADVLHAGVATHGVEMSNLVTLKAQLIEAAGGDLEAVLNQHSEDFAKTQPPFRLEAHMEQINDCFSASSVEEILERLLTAGEWGEKQIKVIRKMSPTSLAVSFRQLREGSQMKTLREVLTMEYRLAIKTCEDNDFYEGVRAVLVDKDNDPKWSPASLEHVSKEHVEKYFQPREDKNEMIFY